jgi:hypothetical protein
MAETLVRFTEAITGRDGREYIAAGRGQVGGDGLWHGWLEFTDGSRTVITSQESVQPNRDDLMYWAQGLSHVYLQGALDRALRSRETAVSMARSLEPSVEPAAVLDPYAVYRQGEGVLRGQLLALSRSQLNAVIRQYDLGAPVPAIPRGASGHADAVDRIIMRIRDADRPGAPFGSSSELR